MPALFGSALTILVLISLVFTGLPSGPVVLGSSFGQLAEGFVKCPVLAAVAIAVHRAVLLNERHDRMVWNVPASYARFVAWSLAFEFAWMLPFIMWSRVPLGWGMPTMIVLALACIVVGLRLLLLFPAIAVATPGAGLRSAWLDSRGRAWSFFWAGFVAMLPLLVPGAAFTVWSIRGSTALASIDPLNLVVTAIIALGEAALAAIIASRFFQAYGNALLRPAE
jgi:hypothetical protein